MDTLNRYCLILFMLVFALPVAAQNQRMSSLFISNAFTNNGPSRLAGGVSTLAGLTNSGAPFTNSQPTYLGSHLTTYFGGTNWISLDPGNTPYTNREPWWDGNTLIGGSGDTLAEHDRLGHVLRTVRRGQGQVERIIYNGSTDWDAYKIYVGGPDNYTNNHPNGHIIFAHLDSGGNEVTGIKFNPQDTLADFVNSTYTVEIFTDVITGGGYLARAANSSIIFGGPHWETRLQGSPWIMVDTNLQVRGGNYVSFNGIVSAEGFTNFLTFRQKGLMSVDGALTTVDINANGVTTANGVVIANSTIVHNGADQFKILTNAYSGFNVFLNLATNTMQFLLATNNFSLILTQQNVGQRISFTMFNPTATSVTIVLPAVQIYGSGISNVVAAGKRLKTAWESQDTAVTNVSAAFAQQKN